LTSEKYQLDEHSLIHYYLTNSETRLHKNQPKEEAIFPVGAAPTNHKELTMNKKLNKQRTAKKNQLRAQQAKKSHETCCTLNRHQESIQN
jgi:hypothetical protein